MRTANSLKQGEQEQVQSAGGYHLICNQENVERKKNEKTHNLKLKKIKWTKSWQKENFQFLFESAYCAIWLYDATNNIP